MEQEPTRAEQTGQKPARQSRCNRSPLGRSRRTGAHQGRAENLHGRARKKQKTPRRSRRPPEQDRRPPNWSRRPPERDRRPSGRSRRSRRPWHRPWHRDVGRAETDNTGSAFMVSGTMARNTKQSSIGSLTETGTELHEQDHRLGLVRQTGQLTHLGNRTSRQFMKSFYGSDWPRAHVGSRGLMVRALDLKPEVTQGCGFESQLRQEVSMTEVRPLSKATEPQTAPRALQCRLPTAPLGWVKCREHISLLIILCIIVYVTNKAHLSLICMYCMYELT